MANIKTGLVLATLMVVIGTLILGDHKVSGECKSKFPELASQCSKFVKIPGPKIPPSHGCCKVLKTLDIPCICTYVTPKLEKLISMKKAVYVFRTCGLPVPAGTKCGSYTVPPMA